MTASKGTRITYTKDGERLTGTVRSVIRKNHRPVYLIAERDEEVLKDQVVEVTNSDRIRREMLAILLSEDVLKNIAQSERSVRHFNEENAPHLKIQTETKPTKVGNIRV